jgi:hypothetical protein
MALTTIAIPIRLLRAHDLLNPYGITFHSALPHYQWLLCLGVVGHYCLCGCDVRVRLIPLTGVDPRLLLLHDEWV